MNQRHERIERAGFRRGEYIGYCHGSWRIKRQGKRWEAIEQMGFMGRGSEVLFARTLAGINSQLDKLAAARQAELERIQNKGSNEP